MAIAVIDNATRNILMWSRFDNGPVPGPNQSVITLSGPQLAALVSGNGVVTANADGSATTTPIAAPVAAIGASIPRIPIASLPVPSAVFAGQLVIVTAAGVADGARICIQNALGNFIWATIAAA